MTLTTTRPRPGVAALRRDRSVAVVLLLMLALVFGPAIGLHVAVSLLGPGAATAAGTPDGLAAVPLTARDAPG
ncbi:hypothetical protein OPKNFCMD_1159 [Methylobacterium crusticola]|uniref:ABC transporter permease n=1 Tax=Methylobacterium crusticola TaxID=1697972 RepID=A0ABQ4QU63_9HYPH|nr:hypothetical protein [Methylobacterium crusticola]GJD48440.1 hypothetical protein OPKNFCMD_1159 [Methylobacterium crusticola]